MKITQKNRVVLYCRSTARRISFVILPKVKKELQCSEKKDIIEKVKQPTNWCTSIISVKKAQQGHTVVCRARKIKLSRELYMLTNLDNICKLVHSKVFKNWK